MRSLRHCTSGAFQEAVARCRDFLLAMASPSKKSLQAEERKRADVARARRRWIREQGWLDTARLVLSTKQQSPPTWCALTVGARAASACWRTRPWGTGRQ